jgi:hypothetical protein
VPTVALRPRSTTEILDAAVQLLRRHFAPLFALGVIALFPMIVVGVVSALVVNPATTVAGEFPPALVPVFFVGLPIGAVWFLLGDAALVVAASDAYLGKPVSIAGALRRALSRTLSIIGAVLLKMLIIAAAFLGASILAMLGAAILAATVGRGSTLVAGLISVVFVAGMLGLALYLYAMLFAVPATVVLEDRSAGSAIGRARELARGETLKIIKVFALVFVLLLFTSVALVAASYFLARLSAFAHVVAMVPYALAYPALDAVTAILYYDIRARKEGYDLELMAQELGAQPAPRPAY